MNKVYLVDYGLAYRYCPEGIHKEYKENPKRCHDGTLEFTSIDAHKGVAPSRRGDLEILGYCMICWLSGKLPWEESLKDPECVKASKIKYTDDIAALMDECFPEKNKPDEIARYMDTVMALAYTQKPPYQQLREILLQGLKDIGQKDDGILDFGVSENGDVPTKPALKKKRKLGATSVAATSDEDDTESNEDDVVTIKRKKHASPISQSCPNPPDSALVYPKTPQFLHQDIMGHFGKGLAEIQINYGWQSFRAVEIAEPEKLSSAEAFPDVQSESGLSQLELIIPCPTLWHQPEGILTFLFVTAFEMTEDKAMEDSEGKDEKHVHPMKIHNVFEWSYSGAAWGIAEAGGQDGKHMTTSVLRYIPPPTYPDELEQMKGQLGITGALGLLQPFGIFFKDDYGFKKFICLGKEKIKISSYLRNNNPVKLVGLRVSDWLKAAQGWIWNPDLLIPIPALLTIAPRCLWQLQHLAQSHPVGSMAERGLEPRSSESQSRSLDHYTTLALYGLQQLQQ
ncbi:Serine/threonine-protein kinase VRK1 [Varanus komodoensis]|nr:Serine/threonine-protein kinase VRK1 [Varanus komodoensis]